MNNLGKNTPQGFIPSEPNVDQIISSMTGGKDIAAMLSGLMGRPQEQPQPEDAKPNDADMLRDDYVAVFSTDRGRRVIEDLLDQTLRRVFCIEGATSIEADALYARQRHGQNSIVMYICKMISDGQAKTAAAKKKIRKAK